eukprot:GHVU01015063.1.p1 GENE.GHVU01015063.1~~GHVU01015063.1.p1  ORF type:complete len:135 (-),score=17.33 GHVU01015063.1:52-456(-)
MHCPDNLPAEVDTANAPTNGFVSYFWRIVLVTASDDKYKITLNFLDKKGNPSKKVVYASQKVNDYIKTTREYKSIKNKAEPQLLWMDTYNQGHGWLNVTLDRKSPEVLVFNKAGKPDQGRTGDDLVQGCVLVLV